MKKTQLKLRAKFAREVRFNVDALPFRTAENTELEKLKNRLLRQLLDAAASPAENTALRRAANDAVALAWVSQYPLLVFPVLLEEKAQTALVQCQRQDAIRERSVNLLLQAA